MPAPQATPEVYRGSVWPSMAWTGVSLRCLSRRAHPTWPVPIAGASAAWRSRRSRVVADQDATEIVTRFRLEGGDDFAKVGVAHGDV